MASIRPFSSFQSNAGMEVGLRAHRPLSGGLAYASWGSYGLLSILRARAAGISFLPQTTRSAKPGSAVLRQGRPSSGLSLGYSYWAAEQIVVPYLLSWILAPDRIVRRVDTEISLVNCSCDIVRTSIHTRAAAPTCRVHILDGIRSSHGSLARPHTSHRIVATHPPVRFCVRKACFTGERQSTQRLESVTREG